jgi:alkanesulfonate monooxygenase SsuD/methylene tetrahydromethanopterin reductase-like flavin-dependent oxidoreductase (luciferase family)
LAGAMASGGPASVRIAAELGNAIFVTEHRPDITDAYVQAGEDGWSYAEVPPHGPPTRRKPRVLRARRSV